MGLRLHLWFAIAPFLWGKKPMPANVCRVCGHSYPVAPKYQSCMVCESKTKYDITAKAMPPEELAALKKECLPLSDEDILKLRAEHEHRFDAFYQYAIAEAARRNEISPGRWEPEDILEELLDHQAEDAAA